ncbi:serine/threonine protein kinase [Actinoplanes sp. TBRC 11911]|uniref:serine/threonine-protein kinase n=1 Tax=Actinoplanes sp. TBRC 11911 TaxID=2729386 RepID=UPI00145D23CC|nr:serine/threonine-protein kinase [Actinoplanes sp. TBRC 11911]NMO57650.1 serine/threonine protein kinase [Actinoplanes sp. TBRC 11911]
MPKEPLRPHDPRRLGDYELVERLGEGGMGTVYLGRSPSGVLVAVKMVRADLAHDDEFRLRFRSEVERVRQVPPFCTAEVLDADPDHDRPYLVVEYVDGPTLANVVEERGPLTAANLHSVAIGVATALTAIHGAGVIHRDLKPRNVLLAPGSPKVIDFGIARAVEGQSNTITGDGAMVGTVAYMAPERFGDEPLTPASDVFAWGGVVAYAGTGRTPFRGETPPVTAGRILTAEPNLDGLTGPLRDLVALALAKNPADRPTARELLDLLISGRSKATAAALNGQPDLREAAAEAQSVMVGYREDAITTVPVSELPMPAPVPPDPEPARPRKWFLPVAVAVVVLAVILGAALLAFAPTVTSSNAAPAASRPAPILADDLSGPRLWQVSTEADGTTGCTFHGGLVAQVAQRGLYKCTGPQDDLPPGLDAEVGVRLLTPDTCAGIWLRFTQVRGYLVEVCPTSVYVGTHRNQKVEVTRTLPLDQPIAVGGAVTRIGLRTTATSVEVTRDGRTVGTAPLTARDITGTGLLLGVVTDRSAPQDGPFSVAFDHIAVRPSAEG